MKQVYPDYYSAFRCLAGACPDTCCKDWQVVIDPETLAFYRSIPGTFGEKVRASLTQEDGEWMFDVKDGRCALLTADGLCSLQLRYGKRGLCRTCSAHPRFIEQYGATEEISLSLSCPAAARLLLERDTPVCFEESEDGRPLEDCNELDAELYFALDRARSFAVSLVQDRTLPFSDRLGLLLLFAAKMQRLLDTRDERKTDALIARFSSKAFVARQSVRLHRMRGRTGDFVPLLRLLRQMEHLTAEFPALLDAAAHESAGQFVTRYENLAVYFLFRYFKKAVNDRRLLPRVCACVFHLLCLRRLSGKTDDFTRLCSLYSKEVEHSEPNLALLHRRLGRAPYGWQSLVSIM